MEPARVLLTGDTHGNTRWVADHVFPQARDQNCQLILQVGDFGVWPGDRGREYLDGLQAATETHGIPIWFIDGNHEDFAQLLGLPLNHDGRRPVRDNVIHIPRGHRWRWGGQTLLALGGAVSIDKHLRTQGRSWWAEESISDADVDLCISGGPADVLITHDIQYTGEPRGNHAFPPRLHALLLEAKANGERIGRVAEAVRPKLQVHGHWHKRLDRTVDGVRIVGLTCDDAASGDRTGHCAVLDVEALRTDPRSALTVID